MAGPALFRIDRRYEIAPRTAFHRYGTFVLTIASGRRGLTAVGVPAAGSAISIRKSRVSLHGPYPDPFHVSTFQLAAPALIKMPGDTVQSPAPIEQPASPGRYQRSTLTLSRSVTCSR